MISDATVFEQVHLVGKTNRKMNQKLVILSLFVLFMADLGYSQVKNLDFENWKSSGKPAPFDWKEPKDWKSTNSLTEWTLAGVGRYNTPFSGSYACQLKSTNISGGWPSAVCNGDPKLISSFTNPAIDIITGGEPIAYKISFVEGHYQFEGNADDEGYGVVILKKYNSALKKIDTIGLGDIALKSNTKFEKFKIDINYLKPNVVPDSIVIAFYSSNPKDPKKPNLSHKGLIIDKLTLSAPVSVCDCISEEKKMIVYPNPVVETLNIESYGLGQITAYSLYSVNGKLLREFNGENQKFKVDMQSLTKGMYILKVNTANTSKSFYISKM